MKTAAGLATALAPVTLPAFGPLAATPGSQIIVDPTTTYQPFYGVGAAMTDSAAFVLSKYLTPAQITTILQEAYGTNGFSTMRISMGSCDYTYRTSWQTYDDNGSTADTSLSLFSVVADAQYRIPLIQQILQINPDLRIVAAPWTPPAWMKNGNSLISGTFNTTSANLTAYAQYFVKFIQAYASYGIPIWAVTMQNEPNVNNNSYPSCFWAAGDMANFIGTYLGPAFDAAGITTKILCGDASWGDTASSTYVTGPLSSAISGPYLDGAAYHGYNGSPLVQQTDGRPYPSKSIHFTEYLTYFSYTLAQRQAIMAGDVAVAAVRNGASSITLWNFALDQTGAPQYLLYNGSPIPNIGASGVVNVNNTGNGVITRTPDYYMLAHLGRFVKSGAKRIGSTTFAIGSTGTDVETVAFLNPDNSVVLFLYNANTGSRTVTVTDTLTGLACPVTLAAGDMMTMTWSGANAASAAGTFTAPGVPTGLTATLSSGAVVLSWTAPANAGTTDLGGYLVFRGSSAGGESSIPLASVPKGATSFTDSSTSTGNTYYYQVQAFGGGGISASGNEASIVVTATVPGTPTLSVSPGPTQNTLTFATANTGGSAITSYNIYRGTTAGSETLLGNTTTGSPYVDSGLTNGTAYYYKVAAINSVGTGAQSAEATGTPAPATAGASGNYFSNTGTQSAATLSEPSAFNPGANPFTMTAIIQPTNLTVGNQYIISDWPAPGVQSTTGNSGFLFVIDTNKNLDVYYTLTSNASVGGSSTVNLPSSITTTPMWVRATANPATGAISFYTSPDGVTYTQLGATVTASQTGTINLQSTPTISVGQGFNGKIYEATLAINGTTEFDLQFQNATIGASTVADQNGHTWTIGSGASIA